MPRTERPSTAAAPAAPAPSFPPPAARPDANAGASGAPFTPPRAFDTVGGDDEGLPRTVEDMAHENNLRDTETTTVEPAERRTGPNPVDTRVPTFAGGDAEPGGQSYSDQVQSIQLQPIRIPAIIRKRYWMGTMPDCPRWVVHCAGLDFPRFTEHVQETNEGETRRIPRNGIVRELSAEQIEAIKQNVSQKVVRKAGAKEYILNVHDAGYVRSDQDIPLGMYLYLVPVTQRMPSEWRSVIPVPMVVRG